MDAHILIVDDNPKNIQVLGNVLSEEGYHIEIALNGDDALELIKDSNFDLILLDIMMPNKDGFEVCMEIRKNKVLDNMPIIFLTAKTDVESLVKGFDLGGQDYLTKPFNIKELLARTKTHLDLKKHKDKLDELVAQKTQQLQIAYKELEVLDEAKVEFLHMLSHEIRTPLNGILGFLSLLKTEINSEDLQKYLSLLSLSVERLEAYSLKALLITSLRTGAHKLNIVEINLVELINISIEQILISQEDNTIDISTSFSAEEIIIHADANLIADGIKEIVKNVFVHSKSANQISISVVDNKKSVNVEIRDNGNGFPPKAMQSLFKPFGFGETHVNQKTGLGLHLVKLIMDAHKINVSAGNNVSGGTFVQFLINK